MYSFVFKTVKVLIVIFLDTFLLVNHRSFLGLSDRTELTSAIFD
jgi:hypothetical protein